jgi:hypothetical protein
MLIDTLPPYSFASRRTTPDESHARFLLVEAAQPSASDHRRCARGIQSSMPARNETVTLGAHSLSQSPNAQKSSLDRSLRPQLVRITQNTRASCDSSLELGTSTSKTRFSGKLSKAISRPSEYKTTSRFVSVLIRKTASISSAGF